MRRCVAKIPRRRAEWITKKETLEKCPRQRGKICRARVPFDVRNAEWYLIFVFFEILAKRREIYCCQSPCDARIKIKDFFFNTLIHVLIFVLRSLLKLCDIYQSIKIKRYLLRKIV